MTRLPRDVRLQMWTVALCVTVMVLIALSVVGAIIWSVFHVHG